MKHKYNMQCNIYNCTVLATFIANAMCWSLYLCTCPWSLMCSTHGFEIEFQAFPRQMMYSQGIAVELKPKRTAAP